MTFAAFFQENLLYFVLAIGVLSAILTLEYRGWQTRGSSLGTTSLSQAVNAGATLVDLRRHDDYRAGHISGAKSCPFEEIDSHIESFGGKEADIVFYCYTGGLSGKTIAKLRKQGYTNIKHLDGGIAVWNNDNLPLMAKKG